MKVTVALVTWSCLIAASLEKPQFPGKYIKKTDEFKDTSVQHMFFQQDSFQWLYKKHSSYFCGGFLVTTRLKSLTTRK